MDEMKCETISTAPAYTLTPGGFSGKGGRKELWQQFYDLNTPNNVLLRFSTATINFLDMMMKSPSIVRGMVFLFTLVLFTQCEKEEPSTEATLKTSLNLFSNAAMSGKLTIQDAWIYAEDLTLEMNTASGERNTYHSVHATPETRLMLNGIGDAPFNYDITIGKYEPVSLTLNLASDPYTLTFADNGSGAEVPEFAEFLNNARPSIAFAGRYTNRGQTIRVFIAINVTENLMFMGSQKTLTTVGVSRENLAKITVDAAWLLQDITTADMEAAQVIDYQGQPMIFIHPDFNEDLYIDIEDRLLQPNSFLEADFIELNSNG
jgi:hypothetical protein